LRAAGVDIEPGGVEQEVTLIASVPLTPEPWRPMWEGEVLVVRDGCPRAPVFLAAASKLGLAGAAE
jgi:hypothetical protein